MALGFNTESKPATTILPIIKFDAKAGDLIRQDRQQDASGQWNRNESELEFPVRLMFDFENLEVGWLSFSTGAPDFVMVRVGERMPEKPSAEHKHAFRIRVFNDELGTREFSGSSKTLLRAVDLLHNEYEAAKGKYAGKVPVIEVTGTSTVTVNTPKGELRFKSPKWAIVDWVERPSGLGEAPVAAQGKSSAKDEDLF